MVRSCRVEDRYARFDFAPEREVGPADERTTRSGGAGFLDTATAGEPPRLYELTAAATAAVLSGVGPSVSRVKPQH